MTIDERKLARWITRALLGAVALAGLAQIAFLPPWEGFDETAHWSYIQQLADTGHAPRQGVDRLAADLDAYSGPMPYGQVPPYDHTGRPTYGSFRAAGAPPIQGGPTRYAPSAFLNWQAQHPPLYYALLAPLYRLVHGLGWIDHLMILRLASFALAWAGLAIGACGTARLTAEDAPWTGPIMAAWPFLFPQFIPEFARLGNDSLCLLLTAVAWVLLLRLLSGRGGVSSAAGLGAALGLGLLTKAFFLAIAAGAIGLLAADWILRSRSPVLLGRLILAAMLTLAIGGWWYPAQAAHSGSLIGADEFVRLNHAGGLAGTLRGVPLAALARGLAVVPATFVWAGTWSLARASEVLLLPPLILLGMALWTYARGLKGAGVAAWAPVALAGPFLAGLGYHVLAGLAGAAAETPGWYLHILAAPLGLAMARGWTRPLLFGLLTAYSAAYAAAMWALQLALFSGCAIKGGDKHYHFDQGCLVDPRALAGLAHPLLGAVCLTAGAGLRRLAPGTSSIAARA